MAKKSASQMTNEEWAVYHREVVKTPTYRLLNCIILDLRTVDLAEQRVQMARKELEEVKTASRLALVERLGELSKLCEERNLKMPTVFDDPHSFRVTIEEEWFEFSDVLDAVRLQEVSIIPSVFGLAEEFLSRAEGADQDAVAEGAKS